MDKDLILWHGSDHIIQQPLYGIGKSYNDYGAGFYCTESSELAKEWACAKSRSGFANCYALDVNGLRILHISNEYTLLNWLAILTVNRSFSASSAVAAAGLQYLRENFLPDYSKYDLIIGYRADDSYFSFARAFINNTISFRQLSYSMRLGKLGEQVVLKSRNSFSRIHFHHYEIAEWQEYYLTRKTRDDAARAAYAKNVMADDINGIYMRDLIREGIKNDDPRLR